MRSASAQPRVKTAPVGKISGANQQSSPVLTERQIQQRLDKVEALIHAGDNPAARRWAESIYPPDLSIPQQSLLNLLIAQIYLGTGDSERAGKSLSYTAPEQLDLQHRIEYYQSKAFALSLNSQPLESAKARIALNDLLTSPEQRQDNYAAILESLARVPDDAPVSQFSLATDQLAGWLSLAKVLKYKGQPGFNALITRWRENYPGHPANAAFLENPEPTPADNESRPASIALFLPETGPLAQAGRAIQAGFEAAYNDAAGNARKPVFRVYDTEQTAIQSLYNQALADGADLIIGPLQKENIQMLADLVTSQVPVLALNHVSGLERDNLYQFGLSPIDDVEEITAKAWRDGYQNALVLVQNNAQGQRLAEYFADSWQAMGGRILTTKTYSPKQTNFSETVKALLRLDDNENRLSAEDRQAYGQENLPGDSRDVLLLNANSFEARLINPLLRYYRKHDLPIYATPAVYSGLTNTAIDFDLDQIVFCDAPWLLDKDYLGTLSMNALKASWQPFPSSYLRLFAMGLDAYHLVTRLDTLAVTPFDGATGKLTLVADNRIKRSLDCGKFTKGQPEVTDSQSAL